MKVVLETIPLWDALREDSECPLCSLMKKAEEDSVSYYLSSAIMTPEVRVETNTKGFCPKHFYLLVLKNKPQSLSLMMDTYYGENEKQFKKGFSLIEKAKSKRDSQKAIEVFSNEVKEREKGCLICSRMDDRLYRYAFTLASLFVQDDEFKKAFLNSKGLCLHHTLIESKIAWDAQDKDECVLFQKSLFALLEKNLERVRKDDWWMTQKYKGENYDKPWNGCEDAHKRAVLKLIGEANVIDPL